MNNQAQKSNKRSITLRSINLITIIFFVIFILLIVFVISQFSLRDLLQKSSVNTKFYNYEKFENSFFSFEHPAGGSVQVVTNGNIQARTFRDFTFVEAKTENGSIGFGFPPEDDSCIKFVYNPATPFIISYAWAEIDHDPFLPYLLSSSNYVHVNERMGYAVVVLDDYISSNKSLAEKISRYLKNQNFVVMGLDRKTGIYSSCLGITGKKVTLSFVPTWDVPPLLYGSSAWSTMPVLVKCDIKNKEDAERCTEIIDKFVSSFKVK